MKEYKIAVIAGDGTGPEVMAECKKVLEAAAETDGSFRFAFTDFPWGCQYYLRTGRMMPEDGIETLRGFDAILLGAVGYPGMPDFISVHLHENFSLEDLAAHCGLCRRSLSIRFA